jgi:hypothetical protein
MRSTTKQHVGELRAAVRFLADDLEQASRLVPANGLHHVYARDVRRARELINCSEQQPARFHQPR